MARRKSRSARRATEFGENWPFYALVVLLASAFLLGGGSRGDILSLIVLRPLAIVCVGLGLYRISRAHLRDYRLPLGIMGAIIALIFIHLIPLPPAIWTNLPGRDIAAEASALAGLEGVWRPIAMVPYRGWNSFYAMLVPAAAIVLAVQVPPERQRNILYLVLGAALAAATLGIAQAGSGFSSSFYPYRVSNIGYPVGLFSNRNHFSAFMCIAIPALALIASRAPEHRRALVIGLCGGGSLIALLMVLASGSRAGLAFAVLALACSWAIWQARPGRVQRRKVGRTWIAPAAGIGFAVIVAVLLSVIFARADSLERVAASDPAEDYRIEAWTVTLDSLWQYMPLGSGIGSFVEVFKIHEPATMLTLNYWNHAHNDWLEWLLEGGLPAAIVMLVAIWAFARTALSLWTKRQAGRFDVQLGLFGASAILILGLWSFVDYPLRVPSLACLAAVAAVWMIAPRVAGPSSPQGS